MLDTIHLFLPDSFTITPKQIAKAALKLTGQSEHLCSETGQHAVTGHADNLRVRVTDRSCSVQGSLSKYFLNDNVQTLTRKGVQLATEKLEEHLNLPIRQAIVRRLDIGDNLRVKHPPAAYFPNFLDTPHFDRVERHHSLSFSNKQRSMTFYDKLEEAKIKREELCFLSSEHHLLRYELRLLKQPASRLEEPQLKLEDIYNEDVYIKLVDLWISHYGCIPKADNTVLSGHIMRNTRSLKHFLISLGIEATGGKQKLLEQIDRVSTGRSEASRMRKFVREFQQVEQQQTECLTQELEQLITNRATHYR